MRPWLGFEGISRHTHAPGVRVRLDCLYGVGGGATGAAGFLFPLDGKTG